MCHAWAIKGQKMLYNRFLITVHNITLRHVLNLTLTLPKQYKILMWNGNNISVEVRLHDMHAHIRRVLIDLDCVSIRQSHLTCNLNDGKVILGLDWRRLESLRLVMELVEHCCQEHAASMQIIYSQMALEVRQRLTDVTAALHVFHCRMATATNLKLRLIDLMWLCLNL